MEFFANEGKSLTIQVGDKTYARHAIQTHFIKVGEDYIDLIQKYVVPIYEAGDILSSSEKIIALCQKRIVTEDEVKPGWLARILCKFVHQTAAGPGAGTPVKMQFAINECGSLRIIWAAFRSAIDKLRGVHGTFYRIAGGEVSGLDGFYGHDIPEYEHMGIRIPADPNGVCDEIFEKTGVVTMIVDANAISVEILGKGKALANIDDETLVAMIRDNPAGQVRQLTPFILIREVETQHD
ncbi:MAG: F420-0--gamma-glutamyl ligase [Oscillospiraceae bacterium]